MSEHSYSIRRNYHTFMAAAFLFAGLILLMTGYVESFRLLNSYRNPWADAVFPHLSNLGDGLIFCGGVGVLLGRRYPAAVLLTALAVLVAGLGVTQLLKQTIFQDWQRPLTVLGEHRVYLAGPERLYRNSFPSGHATAALAGVTTISLTICRRFRFALLLGILGIGIAHSRVYVGAHFFADVVAGALIGYLVAVGAVTVLFKQWQRWFESRSTNGKKVWGWVLTAVGALALTLGLWSRYNS